MKRNALRVVLAAVWLLAGGLALAQDIDVNRVVSELEPEIERAMLEGKIPSCAVALVAGEEIVWTGAYGHSNLWARTPAVPSTVYLIGSTFKTMATAALLQQMEQGKFGLDDPVRDYLDDGLSIAGEDPGQPVTFRHLLTHTSGLPGGFGPHTVWGASVPDPIEDYLKRSLRAVSPPMDEVRYSNLAYTLIAHLVEKFSGTPFQEYMQKNIFEPLQMSDTVFEPAGAVEERLSIPYALDDDTGRPVPAVRLKADVWPAGIVYGTVLDQARWLRAVLNGGRYRDQTILKPETVAQTLGRQYEKFAGPMHADWGNQGAGYGLTWWTCRKEGERHFAHSGSVPGYTAFLEGNADRRLGFAILTNGHRAHPHLVRLADRAIRLMKQYDRAVEAGGK